MNILAITSIALIPFLLMGCLTDRLYQSKSETRDTRNTQSSQRNTQANQSQNTPQKKINTPIQVYEHNQPYPGYHEMVRNADAMAQARIQRQQELRRRQAEASQQEAYQRQEQTTKEARDIEQARQNSLRTAAQEQAVQEARDIEQARQNSLITAAQEQARRLEKTSSIAQPKGSTSLPTAHPATQADLQREEERQIELAKQESLRTLAIEEAKRNQSNAPQNNVVSQPQQVEATSWKPNEGHLVRAGELVMELQRSQGGVRPTQAEMAVFIQDKMGVTAEQAAKILKKLGI